MKRDKMKTDKMKKNKTKSKKINSIEDLIYALTDGIPKRDLDAMVNVTRIKLKEGCSHEQFRADLVSAIYDQVTYLVSAEQATKMAITEEVVNRLGPILLGKVGIYSGSVSAELLN